MSEKDWPQATKNSVDKVSKRVDKLEKDAKNVAKLEKRLDGIQAAASASALVEALKDVAAAIRGNKGGGLTEAQEREVFGGLTEHVGELEKVGLVGPVARKGETTMAVPTIQEYRDLLAEADAETNRIAQRIADLSNAVQPGLSEADANEIRDGLQAVVDELKGVGVVPTP